MERVIQGHHSKSKLQHGLSSWALWADKGVEPSDIRHVKDACDG
jgi:hypothetical protein